MSFIRKIKRGGKVYLAEVENKWIDGKCIQKHLRYVGKEADGQTLLSTSLSDVAVDSVKLYGPLLVLNFLAQEVGLAQLLGEYGDEILSLVYAHCLDYKSLNQMPQWFARTDLNRLLELDGLTEKRLLNALDALEAHDAEKLQQAIFAAVQKRYHLPVSGVIYDVTNTYLSGKKCPLAKYGHDKEGVKGRPLIQIGLGVTEEHGIPLFHKVFAGNIHDARTLHDLISCFQSYEVGSGVIVYFDRGSTSAQNIRDIRHSRWHSLCGLAIRGRLKETLRPLLATRKFIALPNRVCLNKTIFSTITMTYEWGGTKGILAVCLNEQPRCLSGVIYDVTNTYLSGKKCPLAKYGHDKEGVKGRPLIQIGLGVTEEHGIPLFHKVFAGNIHDARTLHDLISCFQSYEVGSGVIVYFDRGSTSAQNIRDIRHSRWHSLCGLAIRGRLKETLRPLLATRKFIALPNRVCLNKTIFYTITMTYELGGTKGIFAVCFNEQPRCLSCRSATTCRSRA